MPGIGVHQAGCEIRVVGEQEEGVGRLQLGRGSGGSRGAGGGGGDGGGGVKVRGGGWAGTNGGARGGGTAVEALAKSVAVAAVRAAETVAAAAATGARVHTGYVLYQQPFHAQLLSHSGRPRAAHFCAACE